MKTLENKLQTQSSNTHTTQNMEAVRQVEIDLEHWQKVQEDFYAQKSRIDYFRSYDRNTSFYHNSINRRKHYNHISALKLADGS